MTRLRDLGIDHLSADERLELMHEIWESIFVEPDRTHLTAAQQRELERRLAEHETDPGGAWCPGKKSRLRPWRGSNSDESTGRPSPTGPIRV